MQQCNNPDVSSHKNFSKGIQQVKEARSRRGFRCSVFYTVFQLAQIRELYDFSDEPWLRIWDTMDRRMAANLKIHMTKPIHILVLMTLFFSVARAQSPWDKIKEEIEGAHKGTSNAGLSNDKITAGLKEALTISTGNAVALTGHPDGFLKNEAIKILLPEKLRSVGKGLRMVGMGSQVDALEVGMNRAAEQATPKAKQIFVHAVTKMTFSDARQILTGGDTAATDYFKRQSTEELTAAFAPIVHQAMQNVGVVRQYDRLMKNPMANSLAADENFNLDDYVVGKTMDGLFYMLGEEEKKIRADPAAQTTALLKEVFGKLSGASH